MLDEFGADAPPWSDDAPLIKVVRILPRPATERSAESLVAQMRRAAPSVVDMRSGQRRDVVAVGFFFEGVEPWERRPPFLGTHRELPPQARSREHFLSHLVRPPPPRLCFEGQQQQRLRQRRTAELQYSDHSCSDWDDLEEPRNFRDDNADDVAGDDGATNVGDDSSDVDDDDDELVYDNDPAMQNFVAPDEDVDDDRDASRGAAPQRGHAHDNYHNQNAGGAASPFAAALERRRLRGTQQQRRRPLCIEGPCRNVDSLVQHPLPVREWFAVPGATAAGTAAFRRVWKSSSFGFDRVISDVQPGDDDPLYNAAMAPAPEVSVPVPVPAPRPAAAPAKVAKRPPAPQQQPQPQRTTSEPVDAPPLNHTPPVVAQVQPSAFETPPSAASETRHRPPRQQPPPAPAAAPATGTPAWLTALMEQHSIQLDGDAVQTLLLNNIDDTETFLAQTEQDLDKIDKFTVGARIKVKRLLAAAKRQQRPSAAVVVGSQGGDAPDWLKTMMRDADVTLDAATIQRLADNDIDGENVHTLTRQDIDAMGIASLGMKKKVEQLVDAAQQRRVKRQEQQQQQQQLRQQPPQQSQTVHFSGDSFELRPDQAAAITSWVMHSQRARLVAQAAKDMRPAADRLADLVFSGPDRLCVVDDADADGSLRAAWMAAVADFIRSRFSLVRMSPSDQRFAVKRG